MGRWVRLYPCNNISQFYAVWDANDAFVNYDKKYVCFTVELNGTCPNPPSLANTCFLVGVTNKTDINTPPPCSPAFGCLGNYTCWSSFNVVSEGCNNSQPERCTCDFSFVHKFRSCLTDEIAIFSDVTTTPEMPLQVGNVYSFENCFGCWRYEGYVEGVSSNETTINEIYNNCEECVTKRIKPKYEKLVDNRTDYYPDLSFSCSQEQIDKMVCQLDDAITYKTLFTKFKIFSDRVKEIKRKLLDSFISWFLVDYELNKSEDDCCIDLGTCCPPCILGFNELLPCITDIRDLNVEYTPRPCVLINFNVVYTG